MIEYALRDEMESKISEFAPKLISPDNYEYHIHATNVPEGAVKPYLVYARINTDKTKTLEGYTNKQALSYMFSIMAVQYGEMKSLADKVETFLMSLPRTTIGDIYIEDLVINNTTETWENDLGVNRGIIDFTIYL